MKKHPFREAIEQGVSREAFARLFAPNVEIYAPMLTLPVSGAEKTLEIIWSAANIAAPITYTAECSDGRQTFLFWESKINGYRLQACTILVDDDKGLIRQVRVLMRPWPVSTLFRNAMYERLSSHIPAEYWELQPKPAANGPRKFTPIAMKPIPLSKNLVLHSPMLAKSVSGLDAAKEAVGLAHQVQSASSYTSIIATPNLLIELFDCDADGYPMEGMWIQKINDQGEIDDLTVMLRPYPAVTVLRNGTKALAEKAGVLGPEFWELPVHA